MSLIVSPGLEMSRAAGWSVTLVADRRELIFVIQTDGALSELVLWDDLTLLGSTILRVTCQRREKENKVDSSPDLFNL